MQVLLGTTCICQATNSSSVGRIAPSPVLARQEPISRPGKRRGRADRSTVRTRAANSSTFSGPCHGNLPGAEEGCVETVVTRRLSPGATGLPHRADGAARDEVALEHEDIVDCSMGRRLSASSSFCKLFMAYLLGRNIRMEADLIDHLFNSGEKWLARSSSIPRQF